MEESKEAEVQQIKVIKEKEPDEIIFRKGTTEAEDSKLSSKRKVNDLEDESLPSKISRLDDQTSEQTKISSSDQGNEEKLGEDSPCKKKQLKEENEALKSDQNSDIASGKAEAAGKSGENGSKHNERKLLRKKRKLKRNFLKKDDFRKPKQGKPKCCRAKNKSFRHKFLKKRHKMGAIIPPTVFLLGGNINDPLNLNSLQDEEINRAMNAITPKSSPLPTPKHRRGEVEVIMPRNYKDPLHLTSNTDESSYVKMLSKKIRKRKKRKKCNSGSGSGKEEVPEAGVPAAEDDALTEIEGAFVPPDTTTATSKRETLPVPVKDTLAKPKSRKSDGLDKIVSPVVPQPGTWKRPPQRLQGPPKRGNIPIRTNFNPRNVRYQYGNYDRYYGYRNMNHETDARLPLLAEHPEYFVDKDVLDIGCNIGHITLIVARDLGARSVVGLDIDKKLISIARKNIQHYVQCTPTPAYKCSSIRKPTSSTPHYAFQDSPAVHRSSPVASTNKEEEIPTKNSFFPISMPILYGPIERPGISTRDDHSNAGRKFPKNVSFVQGSYVLESDSLLAAETAQFDTILCLSVTKWIHLNWGDSGIKQAFRRMFTQLRPSGRLILEAQGWGSYNKKKNLTEAIHKNYHAIQFHPSKFTEYLLSPAVGFLKVEELGAPHHRSKGFRRPILVFTKPGTGQTPTPSNTPVTYTPWSQRDAVRKPVYACFGGFEGEGAEADEKESV